MSSEINYLYNLTLKPVVTNRPGYRTGQVKVDAGY